MTPPINIDGTNENYSNVTIDGQDVEQITIDGQDVLSTIPDSVVLQYAATTYSGGASTWIDDTGTEDMGLTGGETAETLSDGSDAVGFDGTDDVGLYTVPSELEGSSLNSFALEYAYQSTDNSTHRIMGCDDSGSSQRILIECNQTSAFDPDVGNAVFLLKDKNGNRLDVGFNASTLTDGNRHNVTVNVIDASNNNVDVIIDGNTQNVNLGNSNNPSSFTTWTDPWSWGNETNANQTYTHDCGAIRFHDSPVASQTISAYPF